MTLLLKVGNKWL